jgi:hypothetical protein
MNARAGATGPDDSRARNGRLHLCAAHRLLVSLLGFKRTRGVRLSALAEE